MDKKKGSQKGSLSRHILSDLTNSEKEVLHYITKDYLTIKQISIKRGTTTRAVYNLRKKLIEKGVLGIVNQAISPQEMKVHKTGGVFSECVNPIRLHAEQFHIKIIDCDERYIKQISKGNPKINIDGNEIMCYRNSLEVYSNTSFFGNTAQEANAKAMQYWTRFIIRLEQSVKCILMKREKMNILRVRAEYAETNNELATNAIKSNDKIRVVGSDGKVWLMVDNSFGFHECETVHPKESSQDMQNTVQPFFNDLRENKYIPLSEMSKYIAQISEQMVEVTQAVNANAALMNNILQVLRPQQNLDKDPSHLKPPQYFG